MKRILLVLILLSITLIGISCVSASQDTNMGDVGGEAVGNLAVNEDISTGNFKELSSANDVSGQLESDSGNSAGTFDDLQNEINSAKYELNLTRDYTASKGNTVKIVGSNFISPGPHWSGFSFTINGNGHTIDCNNKFNAFDVDLKNNSNSIIIKNLRIINGNNKDGKGGAVTVLEGYWVEFINCTFENNKAKNGGVISLNNDGG